MGSRKQQVKEIKAGPACSESKCWRQRCLAWRSSHRDWRRRRCDAAIRSVGGVSITSTLSTGLFLQARLASVVPSGATPLTAPASRPITAPAATAPAAAPRPVAGDAASALAAYRQLLSTQLAKVVDAAEGVGGHVQTATRILAEGFQREAAVVEAFGACKVRVRMRAHCWWQLWLRHLLHFWLTACLPAGLPVCLPSCRLACLPHTVCCTFAFVSLVPPTAIRRLQKPGAAELQQLVQPVGDRMVAAGDLAAGPRR